MSAFFRQSGSLRHLVLPLFRLLLGAGFCAAALAGDGVPASAQVINDAAKTPPSLYFNVTVRGKPATSYAFIRQRDTTIFVGASKELRQAHQFRKHATGDYLWIRQGEQQYLLDEPAVLATLLQHWQPLQAPEQEMAALERQLEPYTEQLEDHADELDALTEDWAVSDRDEIAKLQEQMQVLQEQIEPITEQMELMGQQIETLADQAHQQTLSLITFAVQSGQARLQEGR